MNIPIFTGFVRGITYRPFLMGNLTEYNLDEFDINKAKSYGLIRTQDNRVAYSRWVSPKRTRSYPFARIYNTYNLEKIITIIPIIKDEGIDGDLDKIQYSTISWMNLLNIYIVLAYYETATKNNGIRQISKHKLTSQKFNNDFVKVQITNIINYKQSALHWNRNLFEDQFVDIFNTALASYRKISIKTDVDIHPQHSLEKYITEITQDFDRFRGISLQNSVQARFREINTIHLLEYLGNGTKAAIDIYNYLGGVYSLTVDEVTFQDGRWIIQESKNSSTKLLPDLSDIQDGLFKLILYSNLDSLALNGEPVDFLVKLKITGCGLLGSILFPAASDHDLSSFLDKNKFTKAQGNVIIQLRRESLHNKLLIEISSNND